MADVQDSDALVSRDFDFERPPVVEVALGLEFQPVADLGAANLTRLVDGWVGQYPDLVEQPPLPPSPALGQRLEVPGMVVSVGAPAIRMWRLNDARDRLLQVQRDRLVLNWQRQQSSYPHYDQLRPAFGAALDDLLSFVGREGRGEIRPTAAELTYVNRLDHVDDGVATLRQALVGGSSQWNVAGQQSVLRLQQAWSQDSEGQTAILSVTADSTAVGGAVLSLTYREALRSDLRADGVLAALDRGHRAIGPAFIAITTSEMHDLWGRRT